MSFVLLSQGAQALALGTWNVTVPSTFRLFSVDVYSGATLTQLQALTEASFTEVAFPGYSSQPVSSWPVTDGVATHPTLTFTATGVPAGGFARAHGWWVERDSDGLAIGFEVLSTGPFVFTAAGDSLAFAPVISLD